MSGRPNKSGSGKNGRALTLEDNAIWQHVTKTVSNRYKPLPPAPKPIRPAADVHISRSSMSQPMSAPSLKTHRARYKPHAPQPQIAQDKRVRRGKVSIEQKIDLHDLNQDQAYGALMQGLHRASNRGRRCVLVVTGKGALSERAGGGGVLRRMLPIWLSAPDIRPLISSYAQAHIRHGGSGAWYVFLKNRH